MPMTTSSARSASNSSPTDHPCLVRHQHTALWEAAEQSLASQAPGLACNAGCQLSLVCMQGATSLQLSQPSESLIGYFHFLKGKCCGESQPDVQL